jgi:hypothetical protein
MPYLEIPSGGHPRLDQFTREVDALYDERQPSTFWRCRGAFDDFAQCSAVTDIANDALRAMLDSPTEPPVRWGVGKFTLAQKRAYSLALGWSVLARRQCKETESINTHGGHAMVHLCSALPLKVRYFALDGIDLRIFAPSLQLRHSHDEVLNPGCTVAIDGEKFIADFEEHPNVCLLVLLTAPLWPHIWSFDRDSLRSWTISAADKQTSELRVVLQIFRELGYAASDQVVRQLALHPVHDVRWEAIKTLTILNPAEGATALRSAIRDGHPHIRNAARRSLASLV